MGSSWGYICLIVQYYNPIATGIYIYICIYYIAAKIHDIVYIGNLRLSIVMGMQWYTILCGLRKQQNDLRVWLEMGWYQFAKGIYHCISLPILYTLQQVNCLVGWYTSPLLGTRLQHKSYSFNSTKGCKSGINMIQWV